MVEENEQFDLDLDALAPKSKNVKLCGRIIEVFPPKFKNLLALVKAMDSIKRKPEDSFESMEKMTALLSPIVPALKEDDIDLSMEQLGTLMRFVMEIASPQDQKKLEEAGYSVGQLEKKSPKTEEPVS